MSDSKRLSVFEMTDGKCFYCGCDLDINNFHMDHFKAQSQGGKVKDNLVPACPDCNACKSNLDIEGFRDKLMNQIFNSFHGKLMRKYYGVEPKRIQFYLNSFEQQEVENETIGNRINTDDCFEGGKKPCAIKP